MPARPRVVYGRGGKRLNKQANLAAACFEDSPSPAKSDVQQLETSIPYSCSAIGFEQKPRTLEKARDIAHARWQDGSNSSSTNLKHQDLDIVQAFEGISLYRDSKSNDENTCPSSIPPPRRLNKSDKVRPLEPKNLDGNSPHHGRTTRNTFMSTCKLDIDDTAKPSSSSENFDPCERPRRRVQPHITRQTAPIIVDHVRDSPDALGTRSSSRKPGKSESSEKSGGRKPVKSACNPSDEAGAFLAYTQPLLDLVGNGKNNRGCIENFQSWADSLADVLTITKIAEASYGEVYRLSAIHSLSGIDRTQESVVKLIALKPPPTGKQPRGIWAQRVANMSDVLSVASEIRLLQHMSLVPGFTNYRDAKVLQGALPRQFINAWEKYNDKIKPSEFPNPVGRSGYKADQLWAAIEMQDAGQDLECLLENGMSLSVREVWEIFWSVAITIAKGEQYSAFEHRDLHLGNICIQTRSNSYLTPPQTMLNHGSEDKAAFNKTAMNSRHYNTTVIDYTLSRATIPSEGSGKVVHLPLEAHSSIFKGESSNQYQYEIYRYMRSAVITGSAINTNIAVDKTLRHMQKNKDKSIQLDPWRAYKPCTNLIWLHFVLHELCSHLLKEGHKMLDESSCRTQLLEGPTQAFHGIDITDRETQQVCIASLLCRLQRILNLSRMKNGAIEMTENGDPYWLNSTAELVAWVVEQGWLSEAEIS